MTDLRWWVYHSLFDPGNIVATLALYSAIGWLLKKKLWDKHLKPHIEREKLRHAAWERTQSEGSVDSSSSRPA